MKGALALLALTAAIPTTSVALASHALVMGPTGYSDPGHGYVQAAQGFLDDAGYDGGAANTSVVITPEQDTNDSYIEGLNALERSVMDAWDSGNGYVSAEDPLYVFGYSQSATIASEAEGYFAAQGIPLEDLHFVLIGNAAEPETGFMSIWAELATMFGFTNPAGVTTPTDLYATDSYVIQGDNWADSSTLWPALSSTQHLEYLGLTDAEIASAHDTVTGAFTEHFISTADIVNPLQDLWDAWLAML